SASAPPPTTSAIAGRHRKPWRAPSRQPRHHERGESEGRDAPAPGSRAARAAPDRGARARRGPVGARGARRRHSALRAAGPAAGVLDPISDWAVLSASLLVTLTTTLEGFLLAAAGGVGLAVLFNQSRLIEYSLYPYAVILQVTPVVAIAPLLLIYLP